MKNICLPLFVLSIAFAFSGCTKNNSGPSNIASVMFVDGCAGTTDIYAKANNIALAGVTSLGFMNNSGYQNVTAGTSVDINLYLSNLGTPLCSGTAGLTAGNSYSVFAGGLVTGPSFVVTPDTLTAPTSGDAKVRFINLSSDSLNESFYIGNQKLDSNITYTSYTTFFEVTASTGVAVLVQDPAAPTKLAQLTSQPFAAGKIYTIMLTGTSSGSGTSGYTLTVITNN